MKWISQLVDKIVQLSDLSDSFIEELDRITILGENASDTIISHMKEIFNICEDNGIETPILLSRGETLTKEDVEESIFDQGDDWRIILSKNGVSSSLQARENEKTIFYFFADSLVSWLEKIDPLDKESWLPLDLTLNTTFIVNGIKNGFGGSVLWFLPLTDLDHEDLVGFRTKLPDVSDIHGLVHIISNQQTCVAPRSFEILWGQQDPKLESIINNIQMKIFSACLVQDLRSSRDGYIVTLKGTKRLTLPLHDETLNVSSCTVSNLKKVVEWVYAERAETRLKLVMDRLSIEISENTSFASGLILHGDAALQQAKDSYAYVILERKDAYHKELRELMKDMKSQSEIYATKVRDLVGNLTRDILGILVFIGFSFIGKFDSNKISSLLGSDELALLTKFLSIYLIFSCVVQLVVHGRDSSLTYKESQKWLKVLQNYTSLEDSQDRFTKPLQERRFTLHVVMTFSAIFYFLLAIGVWNLPFIVNLLLNQR